MACRVTRCQMRAINKFWVVGPIHTLANLGIGDSRKQAAAALAASTGSHIAPLA